MKEVLHRLPHLLIYHFLFRIITGDETWAHNFIPETTPASMMWKHPSSFVTKTFKASHSAGKDVPTVSLTDILIHFFTSGTINAACYHNTLTKLMSSIRCKRPGLLSLAVLFLDDNAIDGHRFLPG
ncbi:hypothetical protein AVEN_97434-1 [Araneus ventricosus]|uniref:Uncharacterized protein n=1 Tax=Araneus ventricosus TaxID=182803 RepID=A0A4Y2EKT8_ARAVE|nr:hypothetical protein AVEN_97434-1 [Araneus ventricosus]